jgi:hypothetical protein
MLARKGGGAARRAARFAPCQSAPILLDCRLERDTIALKFILEHDLFGKPVPTFRIML